MNTNMHRLPVRAIPLVLSAVLPGCTASIRTNVLEPVHPPTPADVETLAVMPATVDLGSEWLRSETMDRFVAGLEQRFPEIYVIGPDETASRLAARSLAREYASILDDFHRAGVVDPERIERVVRAVGATHFLHVQAGYAGEGLQKETMNLDGSPLFYSTKHQSLYMVAQLWGPSSHAPTWEGVATSESEAGPLSHDRAPSDLLESLVHSLIDRIPLAQPERVALPR
jgi:hypothetical protein